MVANRHADPVAAFEPLESRQLLAFVLWDGGGGDTSWNNPLNWSGDVLPTANDDVLIDAPGAMTIRLSDNVDVTVASIWSRDGIDVSAGSLSVAGVWRQSGPLSISGGQVRLGGDMLLNGDAVWSGGSLTGAGSLKILQDRTLRIDGDVSLSTQIINNGSVLWSSGDISADGARIRNQSGRNFTITSGGSLLQTGAASYFTNYGTLVSDGGAGTTTRIGGTFSNYAANYVIVFGPGNPLPPYPALVPAGTVEVGSGTLSFTGAVVQKEGDTLYGGHWVVSSDSSRLELPGSDIEYSYSLGTQSGIELLAPGAAFPQIEHAVYVGSLKLAGGRAFTLRPSEGIGSIGQLILDNPGTTFTMPADYDVSGLTLKSGSFNAPSGTRLQSLEVDAGATASIGGTVRLEYITIQGEGVVRFTGDITWVSGSITGPGTLLLTPGSHLTIEGGGFFPFGYYNTKVLTRRVINYGTIDWLDDQQYGSSQLEFIGELVNRGTFNIHSAGFAVNPEIFATPNAAGVVSNFGTITVDSYVLFRGARGGIKLVNSGTVHLLDGGTLQLNGGAAGGGTWVLDQGSELIFGGLAGRLDSATISGAGRIRMAAPYIWTNTIVSGVGDMRVTVPGRLTLSGATRVERSVITNTGMIALARASVVRFDAPITNAGTLDLDLGDLSVVGGLALTSTSTLRVGVSTLGSNSTGHLTVTGNAALGGALIADFDRTPTPLVPIGVLTAAQHSGDFASVTGIGLPASRAVQFRFIGTEGSLSVVDV